MTNDIILLIHTEMMMISVFGFILSGIDDLIVDTIFFTRHLLKKYIFSGKNPRLTTAELSPSSSPGRIAIFIPAWQEAEVIGPMLRHAVASWKDADYRLFVGVYINDPDTRIVVENLANDHPEIIVGVNLRAGPTTKADCLNILWQSMLAEEKRTGLLFKAVALHDSEDVVHPDEIAIFDHMIDRYELVQLPVLPLAGSGSILSRAVANHYCDEFAESHSKTLTVREYIGASIPSAGVACAFSRESLARLIKHGQLGPFDATSLTEDYEVGLRINEAGGNSVFVRMKDREGKLVATREYFPDQMSASIRQKARWMVGIALSGWDRMGWSGGLAESWMRVRDRSSSFAAFILFTAYLTLLLSATLWVFNIPLRPLSPTLYTLMIINGALLLWRVCMRTLFSCRIYGWKHAIGVAPRMIVANVIMMCATQRALLLYIRSLLGRPLVWEKTQHQFPKFPAKT